MEKNICIIPARKGSKRIPLKNIKLIKDKPLFSFILDTVMSTKIFDRIIINTDFEEIIQYCKKNNVEYYNRPKSLGESDVYVIDVIKDCIKKLKFDNESNICVSFPTVPLISKYDYDRCFELYNKYNENNPIISVVLNDYPIHTSLKINSKGLLEPVFLEDYNKSTRHNDHAKTFRANYGIVLNKTSRFLSQSNLIGKNPIPYEMPWLRSIDIDHDYQLKLADLIINYNN